MTVNATNRIIDPNLKRIIEIRNAVKIKEAKTRRGAKRSFLRFLKPTVLCSKCHMKMDKKMADTQVLNKRENAPICMACILGIPRLSVKEKRNRYSKETKKKLKKFFKKAKEVIHNNISKDGLNKG